MHAIPKTILPAPEGCKCGARTYGQCICCVIFNAPEPDKYYKTIQLERDRLWHIKPKGEGKVFRRLRKKLERYMIRSLEGKKNG